jgi:hypothetical protein
VDEMRQDPAADNAESTPAPPPPLGASPVRPHDTITPAAPPGEGDAPAGPPPYTPGF